MYCLRSNRTDWDEDTLWRTYFMLTEVEAVFRALKSELGLRPIYHHTPVRAEGHLFISVIAYQLVQVIRTRLKHTGEHANWTTLRRTLGRGMQFPQAQPAGRAQQTNYNRMCRFRSLCPGKDTYRPTRAIQSLL